MINIEEIFNKNILIAVDESENASRAVSYVGRLLAGIGGFKILILHVIRQPDEDFFPTAAEKDQWLSQQKLKVDAMLKNYRKGLIERVLRRRMYRFVPRSATVLPWRNVSWQNGTNRNVSTIVVGRQGLSRSEEFLFGSVSSKIVNHARNCTVWVVE
jgi:nucleotide-binding universal stress UspA family protein